MNHRLHSIAVCLLLLLLYSCKDADTFYEVLDAQPEIMADYQTLYMVGDTLTIRGRLNPENTLEVYIGDIKAEIFETTTEQPINSPLVMDVAKIRITEAMGIGEDRSIRITSGNATVSGPSIEIVGDANAAVLDRPLQLVKVANLPSGAVPLYSRNGKGNVYAWNGSSKKLFRIAAANGNTTEIFTEAQCVDTGGAFTITEFNAGAVSPDERYFYFSAKVNEEEQDRAIELFKLCRFDLQNGDFTTLNRTEYSLLRSRRTLVAAQPFEGNVNDVKIYKITALYLDTQGRVYCDLMGRFLTQLDPDGTYSYQLNFADRIIMNTAPATEAHFVPLINNPATNNYYSTVQIHQTLPGSKLNYQMSYMDLKAKKMYSKRSIGGVYLGLTDMVTRIQTAEYINRGRTNGESIYATASLRSFNGGLVRLASPTLDPLPSDGKLIGLYFPMSGERNTVIGGVLCEIDFTTQMATRYAPDVLRFNDFILSDFDHMLDIDEQGMLYMTANNRTEIVKTAYIQ